MVWLGALLGLLLGAAFESFMAAIMLAIIGAVIGYIITHTGRSSGAPQAESTDGVISTLRVEVRVLQDQVNKMSRRLTALEAQQGDAAGARAADALAAEMAAAMEMPASTYVPLTPQKPPAATPSPAPAPKPAMAAAKNTAAAPAVASTIPAAPAPASTAAPAAAAAKATAPQPQQPAQASQPAPAPQPPQPPRKPPVADEPSRLQQLVQRWVFGGNPLVKIGVLILFLGLAFLLRYVAEHTVVPIGLRYAGVAATAIGLLLGGWRWRNRADNYGLILQGAGIGALYLTTLAAMRLHPLIPMEFGFAVLIGVALCAALLAILQNALSLAIVGTLFGFAAPVLASTGSANHVGLFSYLALLNLGIVAIAWFKAWRVLNLLGFACSVLLGCAWGVKYYRPDLFVTSEPFLLLLFGLYVLVTFLFARRTLADAPAAPTDSFEAHVRQAAPQLGYVDGTLAFGVPLTCFGLQLLLTRHFEYGAAFSALGFGLFYVLAGFLLFRRSGMRFALLNETLLALGVIFGSLAIPLGLEQQWTSAAWAVEAAGVYWIGIRQGRVHARLFALLLLFGSAVYFALGVRPASAGAVLDGSLIGSALLAASIWFCYRLLRRTPVESLHAFEPAMRPWMIAFGAFFIALAPFFIWRLDWASTALAILGALGVWAATRLAERSLMGWGMAYQALAGALFLITLRSGQSGAALSSGWAGLLAAGLIGTAMLAAVWVMVRASDPAAVARTSGAGTEGDRAVRVGGMANLGLLAGLAFLNLAPLFVLPLRYAVMVWPLAGLATLWWALRARHGLTTTFALIIQVIAGVGLIGSHANIFTPGEPLYQAGAFAHTGFWGPLLISCAAFLCARLLQRQTWPVVERPLAAVALLWGGTWWALAWGAESVRVAPPDTAIPVLLAVTLASAWLWSTLARRLQWLQLGQATLAYVPVLVLLAGAGLSGPYAHPLAGWGALAWPAALAMHVLLLRRQQAWAPNIALQLAHVGGAWLFLVLAALELRWLFGHWGDAASAWPLLGWMIAPIAWLALLTSQRLRQRWPLRDYTDAYVLVSAAPVALYLLLWTWVTNGVSSGAAAPLPYVPLLNPLELAQFAVLAAVALWRLSLRAHPRMPSANIAGIVLGATAFALVTGMVVRTCHHWGGVPWQSGVLQASTLVQTSLSIVWSIIAIGLMLFAHRHRTRWVWIVGASLVGVVVVKLFLVDMAARGSVTRIVSFIGVGLLLLVVGYFAPLPPRRDDDDSGDAAQPAPGTSGTRRPDRRPPGIRTCRSQRIMKSLLKPGLALLAAAAFAATALAAPAAPAVTPEQFRHRTGILMDGPGPYHQVALPLPVYLGVTQAGLGDLRVFNGKGEAVPHALLRSSASTVSSSDEVSLPLFPVTAPAGHPGAAENFAVDVRRGADGTLVSIRETPSVRTGTSQRGVVVDASKVKDGIRSLRLEVGPTATPFHAYSVETSDDLQQWRPLAYDAQFVRLEHDGQRVQNDTVEWSDDAGKYLRILWRDPHTAPAIQAVAARVVRTQTSRAPMVWSEPLAGAAAGQHAYEYALPGRLPLEQLRINLPQANTLAPLQIQQYVRDADRHRERGHWQTMAQAVVFRLQSPQGEVRSPDIALQSAPLERLRLTVDARGGGIGGEAPTLQVGFVPHLLVFLPRGEGPFTLAWGAEGVTDAALPLATLMPGYVTERQLAASPAALQAIAAPPAAAAAASPVAAAPEAPQGLPKLALWGILVAGVLVLGGMVMLLLRQMKRDTASGGSQPPTSTPGAR